MIIVLIVGIVFLVAAYLISYQTNYYRKHGRRVQGTVIGIERKISHRRTSTQSRSTITYSPIVEYSFNSEAVKVSGLGGRNTIDHKIGQRVELYYLKDGPEYVMLKKGVHSTFVLIFSLMGLAATSFALYKLFMGKNSSNLLIFQIVFIAIGVIPILLKLSQAKGKFRARELLKGGKLETSELLANTDRTIYFSQREIEELQNKFNKIGQFISLFFLLGSFAGLSYFWHGLSESQQEILLNLQNYRTIIELVKGKDPNVIGTCITAIFSLMGIYSFFYSVRKSEASI